MLAIDTPNRKETKERERHKEEKKKNVDERKAKRAFYAKTTKVEKKKMKQKKILESEISQLESEMPRSPGSSQYDSMEEEPDNQKVKVDN